MNDQPVRDLVIKEIHSIKQCFHQLLFIMNSVTLPIPSYETDQQIFTQIDKAFEDIFQANVQLKFAIHILKEHQIFQKKIIEVQNIINDTDKGTFQLFTLLRTVQNQIEKVIYEEGNFLVADKIGKHEIHPLIPKDVIELGKKLGYTTSAPAGWHFSQGRDIPFPYKPPTPQESVMREGHLFSKLDEIFLDLNNRKKSEQNNDDKNLLEPKENNDDDPSEITNQEEKYSFDDSNISLDQIHQFGSVSTDTSDDDNLFDI